MIVMCVLIQNPAKWEHFSVIQFLHVEHVKVCPHLHANTNEAGLGKAYANIRLNCNTRQNVVVCQASE